MTEAEESALLASIFAAKIHNGGADYAVEIEKKNGLRFELRPGDGPSSDTTTGKERTEVTPFGRYWKPDAPIEVHFQMMIEPGEANTAPWLVLGQMHTTGYQTPGGKLIPPPFAFTMIGEKFGFEVHGYPDADAIVGNIPAKVLYKAPEDVVRGKWYDIKIELQLDRGSGDGGHLKVWIDGELVVTYEGAIGYGHDTEYFWKQGIYRASSDETMVTHIRDISLYGQEDTLVGTSGADTFLFDNPNDHISAGYDGIDTVQSYLRYTVLPDGIENLSFFSAGLATYTGVGNTLNNTITGQKLNDTLYGRAGNDTLYGGDGSDELRGGAGDDVLDGNYHADRVYGGKGNDWLLTGTELDEAYGGAGNDTLDANSKTGKLYGGAGNDVYLYSASQPVMVETAAGGIDEVRTNRYLAALPDYIENLTLLGTQSSGFGNDGKNLITGNSANNVLEALGGNDRLLGMDGNDRLNGGGGNDSLVGGAGNDVFIVSAGNDVIEDFGTGSDRLDFTGFGLTFDAIRAATVQRGTSLVITVEGGTITLLNMQMSAFDANDVVL